MRTITREIGFDAGHRLIGHESKCRHLHGHRYTAQITVLDTGLDTCGRVIDFSKIKEIVGGWIDEMWDHNMILNKDDSLLGSYWSLTVDVFSGKVPYVMDRNPTAENMVKELANVAVGLLKPYNITVYSVRLYETPNCWADYILPPTA